MNHRAEGFIQFLKDTDKAQGTKHMCRADFYCIFGILMEYLGIPHVIKRVNGYANVRVYANARDGDIHSHYHRPSPEAMREVGFDPKQLANVNYMNDVSGLSFKKIAEEFETNHQKYFGEQYE